MTVAEVFRDLGLTVLQRGWLSSNNIVLRPAHGAPATVIDTGYDSHAGQTVALLQSAAGAGGVERVVNTHLHSDHCGGNAAIQRAWGCETWVPSISFDAVRGWDPGRLTFERTDQRCERFSAQRGVDFGEELVLAGQPWRAVPAPGHDPEAMMLFHEASGVLVTADALWESRLAIIFPELQGDPGFAEARRALDTIEALAPRIVIPGHGAPFSDVRSAIDLSRRRIDQFEAAPQTHLRYASRALVMFRMLDLRTQRREHLVQWLVETPIFGSINRRLERVGPLEAAQALVGQLVDDGLLIADRDSSNLRVS